MTKVSIIIPVFNSAHLLGETIASVLDQQYRGWEIIIVDDGSTDHLAEVIEPFTNRDERIKFIQQQNAGASAARNAGIKKAKHDWLLFLDADDWIREDYFEKMIAVLENDPSVDVVHCGWTRIRKKGTISKENYGGEQPDMFPSLAHYCPFAIHSCIVRKKIIEDVGGFDTSFKTCGDWDLWQRVARTGAKFQMVKETMAFYRTTSNSLSSDGNQFCMNGLQVISNAYAIDKRVPNPKQEYITGVQAHDFAKRKFYFVTWSAGLLIGASKPALHLLEHLKGLTAENPDSHMLAETLLDSIVIHAENEPFNWLLHWNVIEENLQNFLNEIEKQSNSNELADKACAFIERHIITQSADKIKQLQIGKSYAERINVEEVIADKQVPANAERFFGIVECKKRLLGIIQLQLNDTIAPETEIKDAIATKFSWDILWHFFSQTVYPSIKIDKQIAKQQLTEKDIHDKTGWKIFYQQLWQKPNWDEGLFYEPFASKEKGVEVTADNEVHIEVSEDLPTIKTKASTLNIIYYAGGIKAGVVICKVHKNHLTPQMLRAAINTAAGYELCRIAVREALIGEGYWNNLKLRDRLRKKAQHKKQDRGYLN